MDILPLIRQAYIYAGEDNEDYINGETYYIAGIEDERINGYEVTIWVTTEENRLTNDIDYCCPFDLNLFERHFWKP